jgi:hypothetical protein
MGTRNVIANASDWECLGTVLARHNLTPDARAIVPFGPAICVVDDKAGHEGLRL